MLELIHDQLSRRYLAKPVRRRERAHRRAILLGIGGLILLSLSPVLGHHLGRAASSLFAGRDHVMNVCLIALHELLAPLHETFHVLLWIGLGYATFDRARAVLRLRGTLGLLNDRAPALREPIALGAAQAGVPLRFLRVVPGLPTPAFTAGWIRPLIYISAELDSTFSIEQLAAIIAHEDAHRRRRDPLRLSVLRFLACVLFYLPALRRLADDMADEAEIDADDEAACRYVDPLILASAIVDLASYPGLLGTAAVGFHRPELLERRVRRLAGEDAPVRTHVTGRSLGVAAALLIAVWSSGIIMAHPLAAEGVTGHDAAYGSAPTGSEHCSHHHTWPFAHLFCRGIHYVPAATGQGQSTRGVVRCPHALRTVA